MTLYLIGINYKTAPLRVRELAYRKRRQISQFIETLGAEIAVFFTCNRVEVYGITYDEALAANTINALRKAFPAIFANAYIRYGKRQVIQHALHLACGLNSQIIGEAQVLEQLDFWLEQNSFPYQLKQVWKEVLASASKIRFESGLEKSKNNIAQIVFSDLVRRINLRRKAKVVVVGTGGVAELIASNRPAQITLSFASRKKHSRARQLARLSGGQALLLDDLGRALLEVDALISATASPHQVLKEEHLANILGKRKTTLYLYDLAVPRDIEPVIGNITGVFLQNLDDLEAIIEQCNRSLNQYIQRAQSLIEKTVKIIKEEIDVYSHQSGHAAQQACAKAG
jgi:glutamyl-tRNA reductase